MVKKTIFILVFLTNMVWGDGCGIKNLVSNNNINYAGSSQQTNLKTFSGFYCEDLVPGLSVSLSKVNIGEGTYNCSYALPQELSEIEIIQKGLNPQNLPQDRNEKYENKSCVNELNEIFSNKTTFESKNKISFKATAFSSVTYADYLGTMKTDNLKDKMDFTSLFNKIKEGNEIYSQDMEVFSTRRAVDRLNTNQNKNLTISDYITGTLVLDSAVFKNTEAIESATGNLSYNLTNFETKQIIEPDTKSSAIDAKNPITTIMNTKLWGFYVYFVENLRAAERFIILTLFLAGFAGLVGQKLLQAGYAYWGGNDSKPNIEWKKTAIAPMMSLIFFVAPVVPTGIKIPDHFLLKKDIGEAGIVLNGGNGGGTPTPNNGDFVDADYTTIIQTAIQYFVRWGNTAANTFADYALYPYLKYLQTQEGIAVGTALMGFVPEIEHIEKQLVILTATKQFYENTCVPIYKDIVKEEIKDYPDSGKNNVFISPSLMSLTTLQLQTLTNSAMRKTEKNTVFFENEPFGAAKFITAQACSDLEQQIMDITLRDIDFYSMLVKEIDNILETAKGTTGDSGEAATNRKKLKSYQDILSSMAKLQETTGWVYSAMAPVSYILLRMKDIKVEADELRADSTRITNHLINKSQTSVTAQTLPLPNSWIDGEGNYTMAGNFITKSVESGMYFALPGFSQLFNSVNELVVRGVRFTDKILSVAGAVTGKITRTRNLYNQAKQIIDEKGTSFFESIAKMAGFDITNGLTSAANVMYFLAAKIVALQISVAIYDVAIIFISAAIITMMAIFRVSFYFIEVLMFFVASPAVVIWAAISNRPEVIWKYAAKSAVLAITPILIVLSCYIFIFVQALLNSVTIWLVTAIEAVFYQQPGINVSDFDYVNGLGMLCLTTGLVLIKSIFAIFAGYIVIIKFNGWFLKKIGAEEGMFDQLSTEMTRKAEGMISPIKH